MSGAVSSSSAIPAGVGVQEQHGLTWGVHDRIREDWVSVRPHMCRLPTVMIESIFAYCSFLQLFLLKHVARDLHQETTRYVVKYLPKNKLSAEKLAAFFHRPSLRHSPFKAAQTSEALARIPPGVCASMTYLDCHDDDRGLLAAMQCPALRTIDLQPSLRGFSVTPAAFDTFQRAFQGRPPVEIILLGESINFEQLEEVRQLVSPQSQPYHFSGIPVHYMKDVREITIGTVSFLWTPQHTDQELEKVRTLPEETRNLITSLNFAIGSITSSALHGFLDLLPNIKRVDLLGTIINPYIVSALDAHRSVKEVYLRIFLGVNYGQVRGDLKIHCVKSRRTLNLDDDDDGTPRYICTTKFTKDLMDPAQAAFPQNDPTRTNLALLERHLQKLIDLEFDQEFDERCLRSLMTLPLSIRNNVQEIIINNAAALDILTEQAFPQLERIRVDMPREGGVSRARIEEILRLTCPNLKYQEVHEVDRV